MGALIICVGAAASMYLFNLNENTFFMITIVLLSIYKVAKTNQFRIFGYLLMFNKDTNQGTLFDHALCLGVLMINFYPKGYFTSFETLVALPFVYIFFYYWIFAGITAPWKHSQLDQHV